MDLRVLKDKEHGKAYNHWSVNAVQRLCYSVAHFNDCQHYISQVYRCKVVVI